MPCIKALAAFSAQTCGNFRSAEKLFGLRLPERRQHYRLRSLVVPFRTKKLPAVPVSKQNDIGETPDMKGSEFFAEGSIVNKISLAKF